MSDPNIRFGFVGAGAIAAISAQAINSHSNGRVVAVQDVHAGRREELCRKFSISRNYEKIEDLLADKNVDAVYIAVPNKFHVPFALQAIEAGKHVILEKPFAVNADEANAAITAARKKGVVLTLGMNERFLETSQRFRALVANGVLGEIYHAKAYWLRRAGIPKLGTWFCSKELAGGGCLYDIGVHVLDLCLYVMDNFEPVSVFGATYSKFGPRGLGEGGWGHSEKSAIPFDVEDFAVGQIRLANGATISLDATWARHAEDSNQFDVELFGTEAGAKVYADKLFRYDPTLGAHYTIEKPRAQVRFPHLNRFHNFINHLLGREELCVTMDQALVVQRTLDALALSAQTGKSVEL